MQSYSDAQASSRLRQLTLSIVLALAAMAPGLVLRFAGLPLAAPYAVLAYGANIIAAGFLLTWGAEGETHASQGIIVAVLALVTVLPEYSVDLYLAWRAGTSPGSSYEQLAAANMTGANRLLVGFIWPLLVLLYWWRSGRPAVRLKPANAVEVAFLAVASVYAFVIVFLRRISLFDFAILFAIFGLYVWRIGRMPREEGEAEAGSAAALATLPKRWEHTIIAAMVLVSATAIVSVAEPFAEAIIATGTQWGIDRFLLIQWLAPLASEAPVIVVTVLFALRRRPTVALGSLLSDKINQWTLLVGMLPLAYSIGAGDLAALPLDARQREEFFLTAAQSLFGLALVLWLRLTWRGALALLVLFLVQVALAFAFQANEARAVQVLTGMAWLYLALAAGLVLKNRRALGKLVGVGIRGAGKK